MKRILGFAGSNRKGSINKILVDHAAGLIENAEVDVIDLNEYDTPIYNPDTQKEEGFPETIQQLFDLIQGYDALIIASPEYNGSMPAFFKNLIDWLSRIDMKFLGGKPVLLMSTSPGKNGGATNLNNMKTLVPWWGGDVVHAFTLGNFNQELDQENNVIRSGEKALELKEALRKLEAAVVEI